MRNLVSLVTKVVARTFHSFVQGRLRAEMYDAELILRRDPTEEVVQEESTPKRQPQSQPECRPQRQPTTVPRALSEGWYFQLPTVGVL